MKTESFWRGYADAQNKTDWTTKSRIVTAERANTIRPLAVMLGTEVEDHRGELFRVMLPKKFDKLFPVTDRADWLRGIFAAKGQSYRDPFKLTICGENVEDFRKHLQRELEMKLPKTQKPSRTSKVLRLTLTGEKAIAAYRLLKPRKN